MFSDRLREAMAARQMSLSQVGEAIGQKKQAVHAWATGDVEPRVSIALALANAMDVDAAWLIGQVDRQVVPKKRR